MTCGVYEFWCGPYFYQGSSKDMEGRLKGHLKSLSKGKHGNPKMQAAFNKYGMQDERFLVVCAENLRTVYEQDYIDANWGDPYYINLNPNADAPNNYGTKNKGRVHTAEHRANNAAARLGSKHSEETKAKMSASRKGKSLGPKSEETKAKISAAKKGSTHTEATKAKMSATHTGKKASDEAKAAMSAFQKGRVKSDEHRANMSASQKGRPWSEARRAAHEAKKAERLALLSQS